MKKELLIIGTGGQGIKTIGDIIAKAVAQEGLYVSSYSIYTPRARGGEIVSSVVISDEPLLYPLVEKADWAIILSDVIPEKLTLSKIDSKTKIIFEERPKNLPQKLKNCKKIKGLIQNPFSNLVILGLIQKLIPEISEERLLKDIEKFSKSKFSQNKENFQTGQNLI